MEKSYPAKKLKSSVISSFSVLGKPKDDASFPANCNFVEAYAFMHQTLPMTASSGKSIVQHLSEMFKAGKTKEVTTNIKNRFPEKQIAALATFIPELGAGRHDELFLENASNALKLLIDVVRELQALGHPVQTIELVGGSRVQGILKKNHADSHFSMHRQNPSRALEDLLERLKPIARYAGEGHPVFLAVELEPGPLYVLSHTKTVLLFCDLIERSNDPYLQRHVGLNLDVPHWGFLADISPEWLASKDNRRVFNRIVHAHVSDHHTGHFSDVAVSTYDGHNLEFYKWFSLLHKLCMVKELDIIPTPEFSGFVSCELEACKESKMLEVSYLNTEKLVIATQNKPWHLQEFQTT